MNDIAKKKNTLEQEEALRRLTSIGMSEDVADMVYRQLESYRNLLAGEDPSVRQHNPVDLTDIEILDGAWAFSVEGMNLFRLAVDEVVNTDGYIACGHILVDSERAMEQRRSFTPEQTEMFVKRKFNGWLEEQVQRYEVAEEDVSSNLVMGAFYFTYLMIHSHSVTAYRRPDGGLTVIFNLWGGFGDIRSICLDYYQDVWEQQKK